jgi:L-rhamnose mutarotase
MRGYGLQATGRDVTTETVAFRMVLAAGRAAEYRQRHDAIWPELVALLRDAGVVDYRIFLDEETHHLFAVLTRRVDHTMDTLPDQPVMRRWWQMMADIMETEPDAVPRQVALRSMFTLAAADEGDAQADDGDAPATPPPAPSA